MTNKKQEEIWKTYPEFDFIEVSNLGNVRTKDRVVIRSDGRKQFVKGRILKQQLDHHGYLTVCFGANGKSIRLYVHRIVAITFIPNPNSYPEVNHIDCDPTNNVVSNLEWCTHQENIAYRDKLGHFVCNNPGKPVIAMNLDTFEVLYFESQHEAARQLRVNQASIWSVINGKRHKTAGGYWFCYADENAIEKTREKFGDAIANKVEELMSEHLWLT